MEMMLFQLLQLLIPLPYYSIDISFQTSANGCGYISSSRQRRLPSTVTCLVLLLVLVVSICCVQPVVSTNTSEALDDVFGRLEAEVLQFRDKVKELLSISSCDGDWLTSCLSNNYEYCISKFPIETCMKVPFLDNSTTPPCNQCGTRVDTSISTVRIAEDSRHSSYDTKLGIFADICKTRLLDDRYFNQYGTNLLSGTDNDNDGAGRRSLYFGSIDGMFRIFPAMYAQGKEDESWNCKPYDPRIRPWYTAAVSIRRNVITLLDISSTMTTRDPSGTRLRNMKDAATRVITATTIADNIAVLAFDDTNSTVLGNTFYVGNVKNKAQLVSMVQNISGDDMTSEAFFPTNCTDALLKALNLINSNPTECSTAMLLFTDNITNAKEALEAVQPDFQQYENSNTGKSLLVFVHVMDAAGISSNTFDCAGETFRTGIWSTIRREEEIASGLAAYFEVFQVAFELQQKYAQTKQEVAWVEVYPFYEFGIRGTTVSAPVYDANGRLLGVVGVDNSLTTLQQAIGGEKAENRTLELAFNLRNSAVCWNFTSISPCTFRFYERNNTSVLCNPRQKSNFTCTNNVSISTVLNISINTVARSCCNSAGIRDDCNNINHTSKLWNNIVNQNKKYSDRACCASTGTGNSNDPDVCVVDSASNSSTLSPTTNTSDTKDPTGEGWSPVAIAGFVAVSLLGAALIILFLVFLYRRCKIKDTQTRNRPPSRPPMEDLDPAKD